MINKITIILIVLVLFSACFVFAAETSTSGGLFSSTTQELGTGQTPVVSPSSPTTPTSTLFGSSTNAQFNQPGTGSAYSSPGLLWQDYGSQFCIPNQDLVLIIPPGACTPAVVRSDLLEEQNVPVFCKIAALQVNPLIGATRIRSMRFSTQQLSKGVSGVSYYPARAGIGSTGFGTSSGGSSLTGSSSIGSGGLGGNYGDYFSGSSSGSLSGSNTGAFSGLSGSISGSSAVGKIDLGNEVYNDNLGFLVVTLARQPNEESMPDVVEGNLTVVIDYQTEGIFGVGDSNFYLTESNEAEWQRDYKDSAFWNGKGYVRVESIEDNKAVISIYRDFNTREGTVTVAEGGISSTVYLSGFYCGAGLNVKVDKIGAPVDSALLQINDEQKWVSKGDKIIDDKCNVVNLQIEGGNGKIEISCPGSKKIELSLNSGKAVFDGIGEIGLGEQVSANVYLAYTGKETLGLTGKETSGSKYVILVKDLFSNTVEEFKGMETYNEILKLVGDGRNVAAKKEEIQKKLRQYYKSKKGRSEADINKNVFVEVVKEKESGFDVTLSELKIISNRNWDASKLTEQQKIAKDYYDEAVKQYNDVVQLYPNEKIDYVEEDPYAAKALLEIAILSKTLGMDQTAHEYYQKLIEGYPNSNSALFAKNSQRLLLKYDTTNSKASVEVQNMHYFIDLLDVKKPAESEASAVLLINGKEETLGIGRIKIVEKDGFTHSFEIKKINENDVDIEYKKSGGKLEKSIEKTQKLKLSENVIIEGVGIKLIRVNLKEQVKLSIIAQSYGPRAETNLRFKVGIEKRLIKISPEKAKDMIKNLKEAIAKWEDINKKLGNVIKGLKGACFATSAVLNVKSLLDGMSGKSMARGSLMKNAGGWNDKCEELINNGNYDTMQQCLLDKSKEVEGDIGIYSNQLQETNKIMKGIQDKVGREYTDAFDFKGQVDSSKVNEEFKNVFDGWCKQQTGDKAVVNLPDRSNTSISFGGENGICKWDTMSHEQRRDIMTWTNTQKAGGSQVLKNMSGSELGKIVLTAKNYNDAEGARKKSDDEANKFDLNVRTTEPEGDSIAQGFIRTVSITDSGHKVYGNFKDGTRVVRVYIPPEKKIGSGDTFKVAEGLKEEIAGRQVIVELSSTNNGYYIPNADAKIYRVDGTELTGPAADEVRRYMSVAGLNKIKSSDRTAYQNRMKNTERLIVKYFERAPYKGLPAEIPFDIQNGWYVEMTYVLSGFGQPYEESGRVINFYICNVGLNGLIEFKQSADDICRYYNVYSGADVNFPGMSASDSKSLVSKAQQAIAEASKQYGKERVKIQGQTFKSGVSFGGEEGRCTDFMSATDCSLLFNVCDPVICPASRCDFGGRYRVDDVIQSGIVGSLVLCLPNFKEGVLVPICLSGIHAGIEGYVSILNSTAQCLNESIETGREIGVCDEIKSLYLCDFFWRQAVPLTDVLLPRLFESIYEQGTRGGGEYLTVQSSWDSMQNSANYFTQNYAANSVKAFSSRSVSYAWENGVSDTGAEICKGFVSANFGSMENMFKALIEPDSPEQYHAWFSETPMTTATVPAQSHYKVYYHIYAGNDMGAQYLVYLKDLPTTGYIHSTGYFTVDRGYIGRGSQVDQARDFIAASGFKQLCININGRDECGFGKVSTSYALNALSESFVAEQIKTNIKSETECVAGTPSLGSLLQPNLQAGVEDVLNPQLYNEGIIRVCSSQNPGKQVRPDGNYDTTNSSYDRWQEVGYCDDQTIRCWLDTESVKNVIVDKGLENQVLSNVNASYLNASGYWTYEQSRSVAELAEDFIRNLNIDKDDTKATINNKIKDIVQKLVELSKLGSSNVHKARAHYLLGNLFKKIAEELWKNSEGVVVFDKAKEETPADDVAPSDVPGVTPDGRSGGESEIYYYVGGDNHIYNIDHRYITDTGYYLKDRQIYRSDFFIDNKVGGLNDEGKVGIISKYIPGNSVLQDLNELYYDGNKERFFKNKEDLYSVAEDSSFVETYFITKLEEKLVKIYKNVAGDDKNTGYYLKDRQIYSYDTLWIFPEELNPDNNVGGLRDDGQVYVISKYIPGNSVLQDLNELYYDVNKKRFYKKSEVVAGSENIEIGTIFYLTKQYTHDLYLKYDGKWKYSLDKPENKDAWYNADDSAFMVYIPIDEEAKNLVTAISTKSYEEGLKLILPYLVSNMKGDAIFTVYVDEKTYTFNKDSSELKKFDDFLERIGGLGSEDNKASCEIGFIKKDSSGVNLGSVSKGGEYILGLNSLFIKLENCHGGNNRLVVRFIYSNNDVDKELDLIDEYNRNSLEIPVSQFEFERASGELRTNVYNEMDEELDSNFVSIKGSSSGGTSGEYLF
ncbi:MAG: hypothetical protein ABIH37_01140 [archaeon]